MNRFVPAALAVLVLVCLLAPPSLPASDAKENHHHQPTAALPLSPDVRALLNQEMRGIEGGVTTIAKALAAGNWERIAATGTQIRDSFILKQKLSRRQRQELHRVLPAAFVAMDRNFHAAAGKLARAARQRDGELVGFYLYRLQSLCVGCHSRYAAERFPGLRPAGD